MDIEFEYKVVTYDSVDSVLGDALSALDYKDRENMKNGEGCTTVSIVAYSEIMEELIKLMCIYSAINETDLVIDFIELDTIDYSNVYVASLVMEEGEMHFNIEKALDDDGNHKKVEAHKLYLEADSPEELISMAFMYESDVEYFLVDEDSDSEE